ncbi:LacI family DNA-binding transcriptional regulator [Mycoplasmatota bacterium WC30]
MKPTIRDIAREAGVSVTSVSLVLNDRKNTIPKSTRDRIKLVAKELNYHPNQIAVGLVTKKTKSIGLIVPDISNSFFADLAKSVENNLSALGYSLILSNSNNSLKESKHYVDLLVNRGVDGLIISFSGDDSDDLKEKQNLVETLNHLDVPLISLDSWMEGLICPGVSVYHSKGGYLATKYLIEMGHKKIGCVSGKNGNYSSDRRLKGYMKALTEARLEYNPAYVCEGDYQYMSGYSCGKKLLKTDITAIFVSNDLMAYGVYLAAQEEGKRIPEDISVIGFDDMFFSSMLSVPLTTIRQSVDKLGELACKLLIKRINKEHLEQDFIQLEPSLVERSSTMKR